MSGKAAQSLEEACDAFVAWLDRRVVAAGRGDGLDRLEVDPSGTFWLGRLACEDEVRKGTGDDRSERLDPCAIGIRFRPAEALPWSMTVTVRARAWVKDPKDGPDPDRRWWRTGPVEEKISVVVGADGGIFGAKQLRDAFAAVGAPGLTAEVRVDVEDWHRDTELVVQLVNTSPERSRGGVTDSHLYETQLEVSGLATIPFQLEALPDSFRYDREVPAYGINVGVEVPAPGVFRSCDTITVQTVRPGYWNSSRPEPTLSFERLAADPIPELTALVEALEEYDHTHWSEPALTAREVAEGWTPGMRAEADKAAAEVFAELGRLRTGLELLQTNREIRLSFQLMNRAIGLSAKGRGYDSWRPFQVGFLLSAIRFLAEPADDAKIVDTVWFATGGGKTETYLGLLLTTAFFDRLTGKRTGVTAWSRFPLRLLSLQQTQRFADALAGAELVRQEAVSRQEADVKGAPFSLGFLVGQAGTPNKIVPKPENDEIGPDSPGIPDKYRVLLHCPFCRNENLRMRFDRQRWKLEHHCTNTHCPWKRGALPVYIVDQEIFRFLPTVVVGTLDKAASIGLQQAMRGLVGPPQKLCSVEWHGFTYATRSKTPNGCLVPDCQGTLNPLPMPAERFAPSLRLQDELHLLRDSLGAVDSHYESLLDYLQHELTGSHAKIVASSATLTGYSHQVKVLYQREGRVFPQQGPRSGESFWTVRKAEKLRRFVAVAPRGVTLEHVSDRTLDALQRCVRRLIDEPSAVCTEAGIDPRHVDELLSLYGTNVVYGSTLYDVEAAGRSLGSNNTVDGINVEQLTGQTDFDEVRDILERLEKPEEKFEDRIHVIAASSMLSHGVDIDRLNTMVMLGLPLTTAEFIQTTARVGRRHPGLVYVLHKIGRERDAQTFRHFDKYVSQGDRFVDAIPITRRSRRVLALTLPGMVAARTLMVHEPASKQRLSTPAKLRQYVRDAKLTPDDEAAAVAEILGLVGPEDTLHRQQIVEWVRDWFADLEDPATKAQFISQIGHPSPMRSLRDVEAQAPIHD
ncbi:helicase [Micromonospora sp. C51]|uniref:helicase-related protein n=1 Tax=Micromonospora sp. C51 TaxID=2824879 RepID=UPI001B395DA2|nr:helicase-related protein [Micromonospora sp. C51]MBQ1050806.1 helicase [Micromonospora sp. C51]